MEQFHFLMSYGDVSMVIYDQLGNQIYYQEENIYPYSLKNGRELEHLFYLPPNIRSIYVETLNALKAKAFMLSAGGFRAIIEAVCNHLNIKKTNLSSRIDLFHKKNFLTEKESRRLHTIRFIGNDALHEIEIPKENHLLIVL